MATRRIAQARSSRPRVPSGTVTNAPARARYRSGLTPESMRLILLISDSRQSSLEYPDARSGADDDTRGKTDEQTALDHARNCGKPPLEVRRVADFAERAVRDVVAAVGPVRLIAHDA